MSWLAYVALVACSDPGSGPPGSPDSGPYVPTDAMLGVDAPQPPAPGPPDPADVAPLLAPVVETPFFDAVKFLWQSDPPLQPGADPNAFVADRVAVIRGQITSHDGQPLAEVRVSVHGQPEFGHALSRNDGAFDLAVNGGGVLTLAYHADGYLPVQRQVTAPWRDYVRAEDVVMTPLDPVVTDIAADHDVMQVARGSLQTDADGSRQATIVVPAHTTATMQMPDGTTVPLSSLAVRATEYTVGDRGLEAMPGTLPPTSGYTYAVEWSVDEALDAGATRVDFSQPLPFYVDNYLDFPTGEVVPIGYYDRERAQWIAPDNGRIVEILALDPDGLALLDVDGSGTAADPDALAALGITDPERRQLANLYTPGQSVWRVPLDHFTPWDCNWPYGPPQDATAPPALANAAPLGSGDGDCESGCIIEPQRQVVGEAIPILDAPVSLHYRSHTMPGYQPDSAVDIPLTGDQIPASLQHVDVEVSIAGRYIRERYVPEANLTHSFTWDGRDGYGRTVSGPAPAKISITYHYPIEYYAAPNDFRQSFARLGRSVGGETQVIGLRRGAQSFRIRTVNTRMMRVGPEPKIGLGGWTLSAHHHYQPSARRLWLGHGAVRNDVHPLLTDLIETMAGGKDGRGDIGDGGPATEARVHPTDLALAPDGTLYVAETASHRIRRIDTDGIITTFAGTGANGSAGDGGPATEAQLSYVEQIALGPDGCLYIADYGNHKIRRVDPSGIITTIAGTGVDSNSGDGGPATEAGLLHPDGIAVSPDGSIYLTSGHRIRRIDADGTITTVAGRDGQGRFSGDGGPAKNARFSFPRSLALGPDGSLYIVDTNNRRLRRIAPNGIITTVAGNGNNTHSGDGGPATSAGLAGLFDISIGPDGSLYATENTGNRIRRISPDGIITTIAGVGSIGFSGDRGPARRARLYFPRATTVAPDGTVYIADRTNHRVRRIRSLLPGVPDGEVSIASTGGDRLYVFDRVGRHLRTIHARTQAVLVTFAYHGDGPLATMTDADGNVTTVERDPTTGQPTAIVSPYGQRTELTVDRNGYLETVTNPAGDVHRIGYQTGGSGLMTEFVDPNGHATVFTYDPHGRLLSDRDAADGGFTLKRTENPGGHTVTMTTAEGRVTTYDTTTTTNGDRRMVRTASDGTETVRFTRSDGVSIHTSADGSTATRIQAPEVRLGMQAPMLERQTVVLPSGLTTVTETVRTVALGPDGELLRQRDIVTVNGRSFNTLYDAATRTATTTTPEGRTFTATDDTLGRPVSVQVPGLEAMTFHYDTRGRLTEASQGTGSDARTTSIDYQSSGLARGFVSTVTDSLRDTLSYTYDILGHSVQTHGPGDISVRTEFDKNGNLIAITPPDRPAHRFEHTPVDLPDRYTPPPVPGVPDTTTHYTYNRDRQLEYVEFPDGQFLDPIYQPIGRLDAIVTQAGSHTVAYQTEPNSGQVESITTASGTVLTYDYDGPLLTGQTWSGPDGINGFVGYEYDPNIWLTTLDIAGTRIEYNYDNDGFLTQAGDLSLTRNPQHGALDRTTLGVVSDQWTQSSFGHPETYTATVSGSSIYNTEFVTDAVGRITRKTETIAGTTVVTDYTYEPSGALDRVIENGTTIATYDYDRNGNRTHINTIPIATYDDQDRNLTFADFDFTHTARGQLKTKTHVPTGQVTTYHYDAFGNLIQVELPNGTTIDYVLDGQHRRIGRKVNGTLQTAYLYQDALNPVAQLDATGAITARFIYAERPNVPAYLIKDNTTYRILADHLGSVRLVVDTATGTIAQRIDYDPWGTITTDTNPGFQPFAYAGGLHDPDTGLTQFGARDYDPQTARWTTKDPIGFAGGDTNLYAYVANDPINLIDPTGLDWEDHFDWLESAGNFAAGFGDTLTFGATGWVRDKFGLADQVNPCSAAYRYGGYTATAGEVVMGGIGIAKGVAKFTARRVAKRGAKGCFVAGTVVEAKDGSKPIEELREGEFVLSRNEETGKVDYRPISAIYIRHGIEIYELTVVDGDDVEDVFEVTAEHPVWVVDRGWVEIADLAADDELLGKYGTILTVASLFATGRTDTVYNIEVEGYHTYFVGDLHVWVHNKAMAAPRSEWVEAARYARELAGEIKQRVRKRLRGAAGRGRHQGQHGKWMTEASNEINELATSLEKQGALPEITDTLRTEAGRLLKRADSTNHGM